MVGSEILLICMAKSLSGSIQERAEIHRVLFITNRGNDERFMLYSKLFHIKK